MKMFLPRKTGAIMLPRQNNGNASGAVARVLLFIALVIRLFLNGVQRIAISGRFNAVYCVLGVC